MWRVGSWMMARTRSRGTGTDKGERDPSSKEGTSDVPRAGSVSRPRRRKRGKRGSELGPIAPGPVLAPECELPGCHDQPSWIKHIW